MKMTVVKVQTTILSECCRRFPCICTILARVLRLTIFTKRLCVSMLFKKQGIYLCQMVLRKRVRNSAWTPSHNLELVPAHTRTDLITNWQARMMTRSIRVCLLKGRSRLLSSSCWRNRATYKMRAQCASANASGTLRSRNKKSLKVIRTMICSE